MELENIIHLEKCNCGRSYCDFFNGAEGERGRSYSRESLEEELQKLKLETPKAIKHIKKLLLTPSPSKR